jgi:hypothetical protein
MVSEDEGGEAAEGEGREGELLAVHVCVRVFYRDGFDWVFVER